MWGSLRFGVQFRQDEWLSAVGEDFNGLPWMTIDIDNAAALG